jgi:hypothetical protein
MIFVCNAVKEYVHLLIQLVNAGESIKEYTPPLLSLETCREIERSDRLRDATSNKSFFDVDGN